MMPSLGNYHTPPPIMDYLTVFATCSLVLFPQSLTNEPIQPKTHPLALPPPITLNLYALLRDDTHCAWFLAKHVLQFQRPGEAVSRELQDKAEVIAWEQIDRAKAFGQALGNLFTSKDRTTVSEEELVALAAAHGLGIAEAQPPLPLHAHHHSGRSLPCSDKHLHEAAREGTASPVSAIFA